MARKVEVVITGDPRAFERAWESPVRMKLFRSIRIGRLTIMWRKRRAA